MDTFIKADVFFFITSIFVVVLTITLLIATFYFTRILHNFSEISEILKNRAKEIDVGLEDMVADVHDSPVFRFIFGRKHRKHTEKK